ncbi:conserved hypothetical protein [Tenacibaculum maritimum]|uniref:hypothetical protein n=3 Tax=Tenacibaculum maritimum TaxID=107401 RepID=UPI0012E64084|nr:hypothetical protein [Tenacibaculum maritimum]CAA0245334.1 conserved hypothetical protein [Tenacibaculum maritimum]
MIDLELIARSIIEFQGSLPKEVISCGVSINNRDVKYYFLINSTLDDDLEYELETILHEILTSLGVVNYSGNINYKFNIDYEVVLTKKEFINILNSSIYLVYLLPDNINVRSKVENNTFVNDCILDVNEIVVLLNEIIVGYLDYDENFIVKKDGNLFKIKLRLKSKLNYTHLVSLLRKNVFFTTHKEKINFELIELK